MAENAKYFGHDATDRDRLEDLRMELVEKSWDRDKKKCGGSNFEQSGSFECKRER